MRLGALPRRSEADCGVCANKKKMNSLVCITPGKFEYREASEPTLAAGFSIIKIRRIGICGTDLHAFEGTQPYFNYPRILGHELAAEYIEGDAEGFQKGDAVTIVPYFNCGSCIACRSYKPNCCVDLKVCGVHVDGGMVEYFKVPSYSLLHSEGLTYDALALVEPFSVGFHGVKRANVQPGEYVLVVGAGPIGLGIIEFARIAGGRVIAVDTNSQRLNFCKEVLKVEYTVLAGEKVIDDLRDLTSGDMPTVVIDATGNLQAINSAFSFMAHGGRYILVGLQKGNISFSHPEFHKREATVMSSRNATREDFINVISAIKNGLINPSNFITHRTTFGKVADEFSGWLDPKNGVIKAIVEMD